MAKAPEALTLLEQRLLLAEKEAEALVQDMGVLGISRGQILGSTKTTDASQRPLSPLKPHRIQGDDSMLWQQWGSLVNRVCHMESLLQTLKLNIFRLKTERELDSSHTPKLKQQIAALQQDSEEERQAWRREVMKLRDQLQQAYQQRDDARTEVQRLCETGEAATAAKVDVALAAEELKAVKLEMREKLIEMKERMRQESTSSAEAVKSHNELLQQVKEMERVVETERRQSLLLQSDCQVLCAEVQTGRQQLEEEKGRGRQLEERCQQLKEQIAIKDFLVFELKTQLKRQQTENSELLKEGKEIRAAAGRVQADRNQALKQLQEQNLLLAAARRNIQAELRDNIFLQNELEKLKGEHAQLLQSSSTAQEAAVTQKELHERIIETLRKEMSTAPNKQDAMRKDLEDSKNESSLIVTKLEGEKSSLETQLIQAKREAESLSSALQSQQDENRRLMGKVDTVEQQQHTVHQVDWMMRDKPKISELKLLQGVCGPAQGDASQTLKNTLVSRTGLQLNSQTSHQEPRGREQEVASLKEHRLQAQREIRKHQVEVEKLQRLLTYSYWKNSAYNKWQQRSRGLQDKSQKAERVEGTKEQTDCNIQEIRTNSKEEDLSKWEPEMERWTCTIQRWETKRAGSHH